MKTSTLSFYSLSLALLAAGATQAQTARVQVIHNSADAAAGTVDVWLDNTLLLNDFEFRTASPFVDAPAGIPFTVGIAPANSTSPAESIFTQDFTLADGGSYIVVASGIVSPMGYSPAPPFSLEVYDGARESADGPGTDVLVFHGSTDAPTVDVFESAVVASTVVEDITYPEYQGYLELPTLDFVLQVRTADNTTVVAAYDTPLETLGLQGLALTVLASGFLDPSANSDGEGFGLWVATALGGPLLPLPATELPAPARVQVIHNSADAAAAEVDIYLNGNLLLDDFAFRTATPFVDLGSGVDVNIAVAPGTSMDVDDAIATYTYVLEENGTYIIVANGIVSGSGYNPATPFDLYVAEGREMAMAAGNTDVLVFHGSTDAPTVQVAELAVLDGAVIVDPFSYGEFSDGYLEVPTLDFVLEVQTSDGTPVIAYQAPLEALGLDDAAIVVLASGFLDPSQNSDGAPFGLWVALPSGGDLVALPLATNIAEAQGPLSGLNVWPNPANDVLFMDVDMRTLSEASVRLVDMMGRTVHVHPVSSIAAGESRMTIDLSSLSNGSYLLDLTTGTTRRSVPVVINR